MPTLRVILDDMISFRHHEEGRYTEELTRQLIATAPPGSSVSGIIAAAPEAEAELLRTRLPGLVDVSKAPLGRRELAAAWQHGVTWLPGGGLVHATSLLAPLRRHDRAGDAGTQIAVTIHDALAWTDPDALPSKTVRWQRAMARRAERYADAIIVPTHAVAVDLEDHLDLGDRIRVIAGSVPRLTSPARLDLPERFLLTAVGRSTASGLADLVAALDDPALEGLPLHVLVPAGAASPEAHPRVTAWVSPPAETERALFERATVFVLPSLAEGFGLPMLQAMAVGTPVVHSDVPALSEVAAGSGVEVPRAGADPYSARLAAAIGEVLNDFALAERLRVAGADRARAFSWRDSAEKVWQLHADL